MNAKKALRDYTKALSSLLLSSEMPIAEKKEYFHQFDTFMWNNREEKIIRS